MSYDEKLTRLASTLPVNFDGIEVARATEAYKHHDVGQLNRLIETSPPARSSAGGEADQIFDRRYR